MKKSAQSCWGELYTDSEEESSASSSNNSLNEVEQVDDKINSKIGAVELDAITDLDSINERDDESEDQYFSTNQQDKLALLKPLGISVNSCDLDDSSLNSPVKNANER